MGGQIRRKMIKRGERTVEFRALYLHLVESLDAENPAHTNHTSALVDDTAEYLPFLSSACHPRSIARNRDLSRIVFSTYCIRSASSPPRYATSHGNIMDAPRQLDFPSRPLV